MPAHEPEKDDHWPTLAEVLLFVLVFLLVMGLVLYFSVGKGPLITPTLGPKI